VTTPLPAITPPPTPPAPDHTPAPALLQALAHVGEVDLATGLGRRRLAEVIHETGAASRPAPHRHWLAVTWLLLAAVCTLLLVLG
jgi:hypothetical protein